MLGLCEDEREAVGTLSGLRSRCFDLRPGLAVTLYGGNGRDEIRATLRNTSENIHFCCLLRGASEAVIRNHLAAPAVGEGYVVFAPGEDFSARYGPTYRHIDLMVAPDVLADLVGDDFDQIRPEVENGFIMRALHAGHRTVGAAAELASQLEEEHSERLFLYAAALKFLGAHFCGTRGGALKPTLSPRERQRLLAARDRLLLDLSAPPTIAELAREIGLNQLKLKQGFKTLFGTSIYALFQRHRMERACALLRTHSVTETALTLGYSNLSHFSTAYRKQFGDLPRNERKKYVA
ncbi:helix-turn-helix transcriptional regulator [Rhodospirillum rubrum]|nr:helix-turn-helix transcriptional regulator [Rhodospirillum rubrum]AEO48868.1 AraC family transcriptional regulator [Rhodospirillum rubrum F11]